MSVCDTYDDSYDTEGWVAMAGVLVLFTLLALGWNGRAWWVHHKRQSALQSGEGEYADNDMFRHYSLYKDTFFAVSE